jgi:hypothetical protein
MATNIQDLKNGIIDSIEAQAKKFLDDNVGSRDFVYERAERLATLGVSYLAATDDATRERVSEQMEVVKQSIANELSTVAVNASVAARAEFMQIVGIVVDTLRTLLPVVAKIRPV